MALILGILFCLFKKIGGVGFGVVFEKRGFVCRKFIDRVIYMVVEVWRKE